MKLFRYMESTGEIRHAILVQPFDCLAQVIISQQPAARCQSSIIIIILIIVSA